MFKGGPLKSKGMSCRFEIEFCSLLIMDTYGHVLMGGFSVNHETGLFFYPLDPF